MQLLLSNYQPAKFNLVKESRKLFQELLQNADILKIATGYISADSIIELKQTIEINNKPKLQLLIGMHYFDGFTQTQLQSVKELNSLLKNNNLGFVSISDAVKFHGKMYSFTTENYSKFCIVGSSNLSSMFGKERLYEVDILLDDVNDSSKVDEYIDHLIEKLGSNIDDKIQDIKIIEENEYLEGIEGVSKITPEELTKIWQSKKDIKFDIALKPTPKSNLNAFFGKGREARGYVIPRPWYEVELIISKTITSLPNFPRKKDFDVITDDGWKFHCKTSGDFSKNLRSTIDLQILGRWIKGRLQKSGALKIGELVLDETLKKYGRNNLSLIATTNPEIWLIDFNKNT